MEKTSETLGERLRRSRDEEGLTQEQLGEVIGASRSAISQAENGITNSLNAENLVKAALRLGKSPLWLATGVGPEAGTESLGTVLGAMPDEGRQQAFDFILYQVDRAKELFGPERAARYVTLIERLKDDMKDKRQPGEK